MKCLLIAVLCTSPLGLASPRGEAVVSQFGEGAGALPLERGYRLLDEAGTFGQSNAVAFDVEAEGARRSVSLRGELRVSRGGDGGSLLFLNTAEYGERGPAPFLANWTEPNLVGSFAVGVDVHDPKDEDPFRGSGNYQGLPQREVSLHWDGRELVKRVAEAEFRGDWAPVEIHIDEACGGSEVSVRVGEAAVYDKFFVAGMLPYESRLAVGAGTRPDVSCTFDVRDLEVVYGEPAEPPRPQVHIELFNHVLTNNAKTSFETEVELPPAAWAFGRVILTLEIHDAGKDWDEWDRNGDLYVFDDEGRRHDLVPFITSYRTECFWQVDVTEFRSWLAGKRRFELAAGTGFYKNRGFMMSAALDYYHGVPKLDGRDAEPFAIVPLWEGRAHYGSDEAPFEDLFVPREVALPEEAIAAVVRTTTTGHSQIGEFTPSMRHLKYSLLPEGSSLPVTFEDVLWKTDCYLNPNRPQGGTWKYSRAGWAPGDVVAPWRIPLKGLFAPGQTVRFDYDAEPYDFSATPESERPSRETIAQASQVVSSYLVLYRDPVGLVSAPVLRVTGVTAGSSAAKAGMKSGDYLASYDGTTVDSVADLTAAKAAAIDAGRDTVSVVVYRGAERLELELATGQLGVNLGGG